MNITVFSHVLNEEELLPQWLKHHRRMFTHGVILDVGCTDRSMDIVREMCPSWEIITLKVEDTVADRLAIEIIEYHESRFTGWKIALNITEFLIVDDLQEYLSNYSDIIGFRCTGLNSVDTKIDDSLDIYTRNFGYIERGNNWSGNVDYNNWIVNPNWVLRHRLIHQNVKGEYESGRHTNRLVDNTHDDIYILWIGRGSPMFYNRKCISGYKSRDRVFTQVISEFYNTFSNLDICINFWENEYKKSYDLSSKLPLFTKYMEYHRNL